MQRPMTLALWLGLFAVPAAALAQQPNNVVLHEGSTKQLTPHVWAIYGNPNIAIIVGSKATLVVDTGLGPRNGAFIAGEVSKLRKSAKLFLTTTHAHTEHSSGQGGFPADTVVIRPKAQQQELDETGASGIENFRSRNDTNRELLAEARVGKSDVLFDNELTIDLGDVTARLMWFGPAHSNGDMLTFVEPGRGAGLGRRGAKQGRHRPVRIAVDHQELARSARQGGTAPACLDTSRPQPTRRRQIDRRTARVPDRSAGPNASAQERGQERRRGRASDQCRISSEICRMDPPQFPRKIGCGYLR